MPDLGLMIDRLMGTAIQGSLLLLLVWFVTAKIGMQRPRLRNVLWAVALMHFIVGPFLYLPLQVLPATPPLFIDLSEPSKALTFDEATKFTAGSPLKIAYQQQAAWPLVFWGAGALLLVSFLIVREGRFRKRICQDSTTDERLQTQVDEVATGLGILRSPQLLVCPRITAPCVAGVFRPRIYWPVGLLNAYDEREERVILTHELIHIRNGDLLLGWLAIVVRSVFFFNPLLWLANRAMSHQSEWVCDQETLRLAKVSKQVYCKLLIDLAAKPPHPPITALAASRDFKTLQQRIDRMSKRTTRNKGATNLAVLIALLIVSIVSVPFALIEKDFDVSNIPADSTESTEAVDPVGALNAKDVPTIDLEPRKMQGIDMNRDRVTGDAILDSKVQFAAKDMPAVDLLAKVAKQAKVSIDPGPLKGLKMTASFDGARLHAVLDTLASNTGVNWKRDSKREFHFE